MGRGCWHFIKQHAYGDEETLPDHSRLSWMLALITINMDLSVPVLYTAIIETSYGCDVFTLYGIYYGLSQANFLMPIVCGWLVDFLGSWSHIVLIVSSVFLSLLQIATLVTNSTWLLGAIFLGRQWIINQAVVQSYKLMAIRTHKVQPAPPRALGPHRTVCIPRFVPHPGAGCVHHALCCGPALPSPTHPVPPPPVTRPSPRLSHARGRRTRTTRTRRSRSASARAPLPTSGRRSARPLPTPSCTSSLASGRATCWSSSPSPPP